jgi:hypothetical protein
MAPRLSVPYVRVEVGENQSTTNGLTRRELLKRGAVLGGALAWATPAVQLIGMTPAMATHVSERCICAKFDGSNNTAEWTGIGQFGTEGTCLPGFPSPDCENFTEPASFFVGDCLNRDADTFCIELFEGTWYLLFPEYCTVIEAWAKCGTGCCAVTPSRTDTAPDGRNIWEIDIEDLCTCDDAGGSQSHFEFCFQC